MPTQAQHSKAVQDPRPEQPIDEISRAHPGEWLLIKVSGFDELGASSHGELILRSPSRRKLNHVAKRVWRDNPEALLMFLFGGTRRVTFEEFSRAIDGAWERDDVNARW